MICGVMSQLPECESCQQRPGVGVASSCLGGISFSYCRECIERNAEPLWLILGTIEDVG